VIWLIPLAYQVLAIIACFFRRGQESVRDGRKRSQNVSVLKPIRGTEGLREAIESHLGQAEILCGVTSPEDAAFLGQFPVKIVKSHTKTANAKVGVLQDLAAAADTEILIVNDADIVVPPDYVARVTAPLADSEIGLVTCLYRPIGTTFAARFEGLGVSTDFAPSTLVARMVGVDEFALGSTMAFRRSDLDRIGGFPAIADYLADDYQLGHRIHALGLKCVLSDVIVETHLGGGWRDVWNHQIRWARTIRVSKPWGYLGLPVTLATLWAVVAAILGRYEIAAVLLVARMIMAIAGGWFVLKSHDVLKLCWAIPFRDLLGFAIWCVGLFGRTVMWRSRQLTLDGRGRIVV
jgi:ceramide glucosyltransferase